MLGILIINNFLQLRKCVYDRAEYFVVFVWVKKMQIKDAIVKRFENLCRERKIKPNELATLSGVTPSTVYSMLDGRRRDISVITVKKLCDGLDIPVSEFFNDTIFESLEQEIK